ncbi:hypothetical protein [Hymenobacter sp. B81]|uniref:hypothetical protein n=1 Tax=Hymenobacter sp. B81 TaxID=3344878 RepID=UPI0037DC68AD
MRQWRLPAHPGWHGLGQLTYPLYLLHGLAGVVILNPFQHQLPRGLLLIGALAFALLIAWATHIGVERPLSRWLARGLARRGATPQPVQPLPVSS